MSTLEELRAALATQVIKTFEMCDEVMKIEGHVGILDTTAAMFIAALYAASGRISNIEALSREDIVYPMKELKEIEVEMDPEVEMTPDV